MHALLEFHQLTKLCSHAYHGISLSRCDIVARRTRANASYDLLSVPFVLYRDESVSASLTNQSIVAFLTSGNEATA